MELRDIQVTELLGTTFSKIDGTVCAVDFSDESEQLTIVPEFIRNSRILIGILMKRQKSNAIFYNIRIFRIADA